MTMAVDMQAVLSGFKTGARRDFPSLLRLFRPAAFSDWALVLHMARLDSRGAPDRTKQAESHSHHLFEELMLPHLDAAYNFARFLCRDADAAQDVVQDAFLRAYRGFEGYRGGDAKAWLLVIVRNCSISWHQKRQKTYRFEQPIHEADIDDEETGSASSQEPVAPGDSPERAVLRRLEARQIREVIDKLAPYMREVLILRDLEELSYKQISDVIGAPIGTVMSRLARARQEFATSWRELDAGGSGS